MLALLPLGLVGVCVGISIGALVRTVYALRRGHVVFGLPLRNMLEAIRAPLIAAVVMLAVLLPLEAFVIQAGDHGTISGLLLLAFEAVLGLAVYAGMLHVLMPGVLAELRGLLGKLRARSRPGDEENEQRPRAVGDHVTPGPGLATPRTGQS
jgi:hypothetical protein